MDYSFILYGIAAACVLVGIAGIIIPALPGVPLVFGGLLLAAGADGFNRVGWLPLVILGVLTAMAFAAEIIGSLLGAKRVGASRLALLGAAVGTLAAFPFGFFGLLLGPFLGAVGGELVSRQRLDTAARVGLGTWIGLAVGSLAKIALLFAMLGVFLSSYLLD